MSLGSVPCLLATSPDSAKAGRRKEDERKEIARTAALEIQGAAAARPPRSRDENPSRDPQIPRQAARAAQAGAGAARGNDGGPGAQAQGTRTDPDRDRGRRWEGEGARGCRNRDHKGQEEIPGRHRRPLQT